MTNAHGSRAEGAYESRLDQLTLEEKVGLMAGGDIWTTVPVPRLGVPSIRVTDGPNGARGSGSLTGGIHSACFPCGISLGATWSPALMRRIGEALGEEVRAKGSRVLLGPTINLHRTALNGRNFECYSEDPHLTAMLAVPYVEGVQSRGVAATAKHFAGNESEFQRMSINSEISQRALRELYLRPFEAAVKDGGVKLLMSGYNRLNGPFCADSGWLLTDVAKIEWGFDGVVVSDWFGLHSTDAGAQAGLDLEMPGPTRDRGDKLVGAVRAGRVETASIDDSARRVLRLLDWVGASEATDPGEERYIDRPSDRALIREAAAEGMVLLRNDGALPLDASGLRSIAVIGPNAQAAQIMGGGSAQLNALHRVSPWDALTERLGGSVQLGYAKGAANFRLEPVLPGPASFVLFDNDELQGEPVSTEVFPAMEHFWFGPPFGPDRGFSARATSTFTPADSGEYEFGLVSAGRSRLFVDGAEVVDNWTGWRIGENYFGAGNEEVFGAAALEAGRTYQIMVEYSSKPTNSLTIHAFRAGASRRAVPADIKAAAALAGASDVALLFVGANGEWDSEGRDRPGLALPGLQDELIAAVVRANPRTVVVLQTGGPVAMPWAGKVSAILQAWYPGQECGYAICDVLFGDAEPGGRLPQTFPVRVEESSAIAHYPGGDGVVRYGEGIFIGYRHHDHTGAAPLFPFGFGLSYTRFEYGQAKLARSGDELRWRVSVPVTNVGDRPGSDVAQLYVHDLESSVERPRRELKGFTKLHLQPGQTQDAVFDLDFRSLAYFDEARGGWVAEAGRFQLTIGGHIDDVRCSVEVVLDETVFAPLKA